MILKSRDAMIPLYDIRKTYLENSEEGPYFPFPLPPPIEIPESAYTDVLGMKVKSKIGVPAGPLLNSRFIALADSLSFPIVVYKTIRSKEHPGHPLPNILFVKADEPLSAGSKVYASENPPETFDKLAITNSFGMPSRSKEYLLQDIQKARQSLSKGSILIVSVVGFSEKGNLKELIEDFTSCALFAKDAGAMAIEANFSCPNVSLSLGSLYLDAAASFSIALCIKKALQGTPLVIKVGQFPTKERMKETLFALSKAGVQAISGINTISCTVIDKQGDPALSQNRKTSGICGSLIFPNAQQFVRDARALIDQEKLPLELFGMGGVTKPDDFEALFQEGADVVMSGTGMMWDPYLAIRYHQRTQQ